MKPTNQPTSFQSQSSNPPSVPTTQPPSHPATKKPFILPPSAFILLLYALLTLILTCPLITNLSTTVPNDIGDPLLNTWILAWDTHALLADPRNFFQANIFYPLPNALAYSEHLFSSALLATPFQLISSEPIVAYNLSLLLTFPLAAFGMYLLALHWTHHRGAAFIAGLIFAFAPYRFAAIAHLQLLTFQWLPYALLFLDKIFNQPPNHLSVATTQPPFSRNHLTTKPPNHPPHHYFALGLFLLLQILASWYLAIYTVLILGIFLLIMLFTRRFQLSRWARLVGLFLLLFLMVLPFARPYLTLVAELQASRTIILAISLAAFPTDYLAAAPANRIFGPLTELFRSRPYFTDENTLFIGLTAPLLALVALLLLLRRYLPKKSPAASSRFPNRRPNQLGLFLILFVTFLLTFPTTYALVAVFFPVSSIVRVPPRWVIPLLFALAGLAAFGYAAIHTQLATKYSRPVLAKFFLALISITLLLETISIPLPLAPVDNQANLNPAYHWLARQNGRFALVELPLHSAPASEFPEAKRLYASTLGWWPLVNGYSGYTPPRQTKLALALALFPGQPAIDALQELAPASIAYGQPPRPLLLLVHPGEAPLDRSLWETNQRWQAERNPALFPLGEFEGEYLYQLRSPDPRQLTAPPLATFGDAHPIRLLALKLAPTPAEFSRPRDRENPIDLDLSPSMAKPRLILYWQALAPLSTDYTAFIHLRAPDGFVRSQADGPPVSGHYPTTAWPPGQIIQDVHPLPSVDFSQIDHLALGLYDPDTGQRLPAFGPEGNRLPEDALVVPLP